MTLVSMGLTAPATPLLASGTAAEVEDLTGSDKGVTTDAEFNTGVHTENIVSVKRRSGRQLQQLSSSKVKAALLRRSSCRNVVLRVSLLPRNHSVLELGLL